MDPDPLETPTALWGRFPRLEQQFKPFIERRICHDELTHLGGPVLV